MPRSRRRYDDDDRPIRRRTRRKAGGGSTVLILAILGGVLLFCGGIGGGFYLLAIHPKVEMAQRIRDDIKKEEAEAKVSKTKLGQLWAGMTLADVEAVLGPGNPTGHFDVMATAGNFHNMEEVESRWNPAAKAGRVYVWQEYTDRILVAFSADPKRGGTVVGILASIDRSKTYTEPVPLPRGFAPRP